MAHKSHNPDDLAFRAELGELLRPAVEEVRQSPPPAASLERALARARRIGQPKLPPAPARLRFGSRMLLIAGALAASLFLGVVPQHGTTPPGYQAKEHPSKGDELAQTVDPPMPQLPGQADENPPVVAFPGQIHLHPRGQSQDVFRASLGLAGCDWRWERLEPPGGRDGQQVFHQQAVSLLHHQPGPVVWRLDAKRAATTRIADSDGRALKLTGLSVAVRVEGARARTVIDHILHNPHALAVDANFEAPLPEGATPSWFTFFPGHGNVSVQPDDKGKVRSPLVPSPEELVRAVDTRCWGQPRHATVVPVEERPEPRTSNDLQAVVVDKEGVAVLPGNTFRGRIGPIGSGAYVRVVLAYEETLPMLNGRLVYSYSYPTQKLPEARFALRTSSKLARDVKVQPDLALRPGDPDAALHKAWRGAAPGEVKVQLIPKMADLQPVCGRPTGGDEGPFYLHARLRPEDVFQGEQPTFARRAVFLLDTSAAENATRLDLRIQLLKRILETDKDIERFNVLVFNSASAWLSPGEWCENTPRGRQNALAKLDGLLLEGGTNLDAAFRQLANPGLPGEMGMPVQAFLLSDGRPTQGETLAPRLAHLVASNGGEPRWRLRWNCFADDTGSENADLFAALTRNGGCIVPLATARDVEAAAGAHRRPCLRITDLRFKGDPVARDLVVGGGRRAIMAGGELVLAARFDRPGPVELELRGEVAGRAVTRRYALEIGESDAGDLAARGWAELTVQSLLSVRKPALDRAAERIAQAFNIPSRLTSFSLPEDPEPLTKTRPPAEPRDLSERVASAWRLAEQPEGVAERREMLARFVESWPDAAVSKTELQGILDALDDAALTLPAKELAFGVPLRGEAAASYLDARKKDRRNMGAYLQEAARRAAAGKADAGARCALSLLDELPDRPDVTRLTAYSLLGMGQKVDAARVVLRLVESEPHNPATHRTMARCLDELGKFGWAAFHYEAALGQLGGRGGWHSAVRAEYALLARRVVSDAKIAAPLRERLQERLTTLGGAEEKGDLSVALTWNTVAARMELRVVGPDGKQLPATGKTQAPGHLQGPHLVIVRNAMAGQYKIDVLYRDGSVTTLPEVCARVEVVQGAGSPERTASVFSGTLRQPGDRWRSLEMRGPGMK